MKYNETVFSVDTSCVSALLPGITSRVTLDLQRRESLPKADIANGLCFRAADGPASDTRTRSENRERARSSSFNMNLCLAGGPTLVDLCSVSIVALIGTYENIGTAFCLHCNETVNR